MSADAIRRSYEIGRLRTSLVRAAIVTVPLALVAFFVVGPSALAWLPVTLSAWTLAYWRGSAVQKGALFGLLGGVATMLLPLSILRPCCDGMAMNGADCCTRPECCLLSGAVIGAALAMVVPVKKDSWWKTTAGVVLGVASVAMLRCSTLYLGEAIGLVGGLLAGVAAASIARRVYSNVTSTSAS